MTPEIDTAGLGARIESLPGFSRLREASKRVGERAYLVGGAVRDALLGSGRSDLDLVTEGDHLRLAAALGAPVHAHERFQTATVEMPWGFVDVVRARAESYPHPGALPEVRPAGLEEDLARRDFTINSIAVALDQPGEPIDPHGGIGDLRNGVLRALHPDSFADDPTRALRAARYAARLGLELDGPTDEWLRGADLTTVSADRAEAELRKLALEERPRRGFELLDQWGMVQIAPEAGELIDELARLLAAGPWRGLADRAEAIVTASRGVPARARELADAAPASPSAAVAVARGATGVELAVARALGATWLDRYVEEWRHVRLEISGADLLEAGIEQGPAVGRGLAAALRARLDGAVSDRESELEVALAAVRDEG